MVDRLDDADSPKYLDPPLGPPIVRHPSHTDVGRLLLYVGLGLGLGARVRARARARAIRSPGPYDSRASSCGPERNVKATSTVL